MRETAEEILAQQRYANLSLGKLINTLHHELVDFDEPGLRQAFNRREVNQITKQPKKHIRFAITAPPGTYQVDIIFVPTTTAATKQRPFLLFVEISSRKAFAYPMKNKSLTSIIDAYEKFLMEEGGNLITLEGDDDFNKPRFRKLVESQAVNLVTFVAKDIHINRSGDALGIIDRAVRTLKRLVRKLGLLKGNTFLARYFLEAVDNYNQSTHSAFKNEKTPNEMHEDFDTASDLNKSTALVNNLQDSDRQSLKVGDKVRILVETNTFAKEKPPFSQQLYEITKKDGLKYKVKNLDTMRVMRRRFNARELQKVDVDDLQKLPRAIRPITPQQERANQGARKRRMAREGIYNDFELEKLSENPIPKLVVDTKRLNRTKVTREVAGKKIKILGPKRQPKNMESTLKSIKELEEPQNL